MAIGAGFSPNRYGYEAVRTVRIYRLSDGAVTAVTNGYWRGFSAVRAAIGRSGWQDVEEVRDERQNPE